MTAEQTRDNAESQARAQLASIVDMVRALECDYDRLQELRDERDTHEDAAGDFDTESTRAAWADANQDDAAELAELQAAAGECTDSDEARQRIEEDALSVEVRGAWRDIGETEELDEFRILLCTGGPAVQIVGELNDGDPSHVSLQYRDWGTPWTELVNITDDERDALLSYFQVFYFGA